ncbi:2,4-dienoyl-CoA reductase-like NADH-dependent reductase (Old Yellow Enzyme family) [Pedobacter cryoconitis]|uniref:alkene reductase n=1 Tax=Pedobacter cryoconitis TaxID=188932 RepID=UPI001609BEFF|nr:alkene reductase [Pedobacter cryoconitis]MBB6273889.1 2,4-dienoyl-CoA reductase-like NADH-dependent reductase (Old Yellow Enzyme family) [Pedobacter cryoconitis]
MKKLLEQIRIGDLNIKNRIIMAPLTRCRCAADAIPNEIMVDYYRQRAGAGLIIAEATAVTPMGLGYPNTPGIWSEPQIKAWKKITDAVHQEEGKIFLQIWHVGRMSDPVYLHGQLPVAPSPIAPKGHISLIRPQKGFVIPRELELSEISGIVEAFKKGAENAMKAGFDGVEIHGANGYLLNQFFNEGSNQRTDIYGGSLENRARLMLDVVDAVVSVCGAGRVGLHISPQEDEHSMLQSDYATTLKEYAYLMEEVNKRQIAFVFVREGFHCPNRFGLQLKNIFNGTFIINEDFTPAQAENAVKNGQADAAAFGRLFISNPDLPERIKRDAGFNELVPERYYFTPIESGYTDYPTL